MLDTAATLGRGACSAQTRRLSRASRWAVATILVSAAAASLTPHAIAQSTSLGGANERLDIDETQPMLLQADELIYSNDNNTVTARGSVEVYYNNYTLLADQVVYKQDANTLEAVGNVRIKEPNGAIVTADRITLSDDFRDGFIGSLQVVSTDETRIGAASARREGDTTTFERGVFTPCKVCEDQPEKPPLWQIRAAKIVQDEEKGDIYYEDAAFEFMGVPVFYTPYFQHPDPSVKRRSGFLIPKLGHSGDLGFWTEVPYFYEIAPNADLTVAPRYMTEEGLLLQGEFRHRLGSGAYSVDFAGIYQDEGDQTSSGASTTPDNEWRGSLISEGRFGLGSWWHAGWDVTLESDDTFRRYYKLDSVISTQRTSMAYLEGISDRNYLGAYLYHFGGLLPDDEQDSESAALPSVDYNYIFEKPIFGGELAFNANAVSLQRDDGVGNETDSSHAIAEVSWQRQIIDTLGQVFTPFASARGDIYSVNVDDSIDPTAGTQTVTRATGTLGFEYSFPLVAHTAQASHVVEPIAQVLSRPNSVENDEADIPNEDARSLVFDDTLLFDRDKFSGYDRIETGTRANIGIRYTMQSQDAGYARVLFGQSYHLAGDNAFDAGTGLSTDASDFVAGFYYEPSSALQLTSQTRFDNDTFDVQRQDLAAHFNYGPAAASLNYAFTRGNELSDDVELAEDQQEVLGSGALRLTENWSLLGAARFDVEEQHLMHSSVGLRYADECYMISVSYLEDRITTDLDEVDGDQIDTDQSVLIRFSLKHIGGAQYQTDITDTLEADGGLPF